MNVKQDSRVLVPDVLPLELWHEIAALTKLGGDDSHLVSWLSVAPGFVACHMHDAAFTMLFRDVRLKLSTGANGADEALAHLGRILKRREQCLAVRRLEIWASSVGISYAAETMDEIALSMVNALTRFPLLQEFIWDDSDDIDLPMPPHVLTSLLSTNKRLRRLQIGALALDSVDTPQIDLTGLNRLVQLQVTYKSPLEILFPKTLQTLDLVSPRIEGNTTLETLANNALSLSKVSIARTVIPSNFWYRNSPYTALHTVHLIGITPPCDTGLDLGGVTTLRTLHLRHIHGVNNIGLLPICIRASETLRNFSLYHVSAARETASLLSGINILSLESLALALITLTPEDTDSIVVSRQGNSEIRANHAEPSLARFTLTRLNISGNNSSAVLGSSRPFPVLRTLEVQLTGALLTQARDFFNCLGSFLDRANALKNLAITLAFLSQFRSIERSMVDSFNFLSCLKTASPHLQHFSFPVHALTLDHPFFHELGDALLHNPEISLACLKGTRHNAQAFTETHFHLLDKFTALKHLHIYNHDVSFGRTAVESLARHVPPLRTFAEHEKTWEIQRNALTGEFQRVVCTPVSRDHE
ncbi:hypothetical protein DFH06DRAFT_455130 [Mycena polygramma]|nr:hypothetical protein DFH06DRAFT_455130 [Mycena polygramma]